MDNDGGEPAVTGDRRDPLPRSPPDPVTAGYRGPIPPASKVFTILMFAALFLLARRWREKSRTSTPMLAVITPSEIAALVSLIASFIYLVSSQLF